MYVSSFGTIVRVYHNFIHFLFELSSLLLTLKIIQYLFTFLMNLLPSPSGPFGAEKRHGAHLRHEDFEKSRHAGKRTGEVFVSTAVLDNP